MEKLEPWYTDGGNVKSCKIYQAKFRCLICIESNTMTLTFGGWGKALWQSQPARRKEAKLKSVSMSEGLGWNSRGYRSMSGHAEVLAGQVSIGAL